jgi:hypothetical protein
MYQTFTSTKQMLLAKSQTADQSELQLSRETIQTAQSIQLQYARGGIDISRTSKNTIGLPV